MPFTCERNSIAKPCLFVVWDNIYALCIICMQSIVYHTYFGKIWQQESLENLLSSSIWQKKFGKLIARSTKSILIVSTNLDGFNLANHRLFAKHSLPPNFPTIWQWEYLAVICLIKMDGWRFWQENVWQVNRSAKSYLLIQFGKSLMICQICQTFMLYYLYKK